MSKQEFSIGAAVSCLNAHFPNLNISNRDIKQSDANYIKYLLNQYQRFKLTEREMEQEMKRVIQMNCLFKFG